MCSSDLERFVLAGYRAGTLLPLPANGFGGEPGIAHAVAGTDPTAGPGGPAASGTDAGRSLWSSLGFTEQPDWRRWVRTPWSS